MQRRITVTLGLSILASVVAAGTLPGCGPGQIAEPASPVVSADSEAAKKARQQDEELKAQRQKEEARARKRMRGLPSEE
jgi:hypothetical protein